MKRFLKPKLIFTFVTLLILAAAITVPLLSGSIRRSHAAPPRKPLVILLQGIDTSLTLTDIRKQITSGHSAKSIVGMGVTPTTAKSVLPSNADFFEYSYAGSGPRTGNPIPYSCVDTFSNPIFSDIALLRQQIFRIVAAEPAGTQTDLYLIGHSLGGVVAFGFLALLEEHIANPSFPQGMSLPPGTHLRSVITLDSPIGGIADSGYVSLSKVLFSAVPFIPTHCDGLRIDQFTSPSDLRKVFDSPTTGGGTTPPDDGGTDPQGARGSIFAISGVSNPTPQLPFLPSNEVIAESAQIDLGTSFLAIGNEDDHLWNPQPCIDTIIDVISAHHPSQAILLLLAHLAHVTIPNFRDTQFLEDEGDGNALYGRSFAKGSGVCVLSLANFLNHKEVLTNSGVQTGITNFLTSPVGGTPNPLVAVPGPDDSSSVHK